jgi:hypothetical protein
LGYKYLGYKYLGYKCLDSYSTLDDIHILLDSYQLCELVVHLISYRVLQFLMVMRYRLMEYKYLLLGYNYLLLEYMLKLDVFPLKQQIGPKNHNNYLQ